MSTLTPEVTWAQRSSDSDETRNNLYVFINVPDVSPSSADIKLTSNNVSFTGSNIKGTKYHVELPLYEEIDTENSKVHHSPRGVEMVLRKKKLGTEYWPRLLKESKKVHFVKTDFDKWVDEDEQDEVADDDYAANFGGFGEDGGLGGIDFSKLGGGADLGAGAAGGEEDEEDEDDDDLPELEGDDKPTDKKIEEVA